MAHQLGGSAIGSELAVEEESGDDNGGAESKLNIRAKAALEKPGH